MTILVPALAMASTILALMGLARRRDPHAAALVDAALGEAMTLGRSPWSPLARLGQWATGIGVRPGAPLVRRLELAGTSWSVEQMAGFRVALTAGAAAFSMVLAFAIPRASMVAPVLLVATLRGPEFVLARRGRRRQSAIEWSVPDLVELLVATTEAGLAPAVALERSAAVVGGPLGDELRRVSREVTLGVPWRVAMERLVERTEVPSLRRLAAALARSHRLGTPVRAALRSVAGDLRADRRARAEEIARRAPVKMLFPLVFLILPAFLLLTVGPVVLATVHSLKSGG